MSSVPSADPASTRPTYVIVTPARDEEDNIENTVRSVAEQEHRPLRWVVVNDGSSDRTGELLDAAAREHEWLRVVHREDRGFRAAGSGVMEAFYAGFAELDGLDWDYLVKLDGDLRFAPDYFRRCLERMQADERLGIAGGVIYNEIDGQQVLERHPRFHVRGATKIYKRALWEAIGGLIRQPGWDTLDEVHAQMLGFDTQSFDDLCLYQLRETGEAAGQWRNWVKNGRASYIIGYHPLFLLAKAVRRCFKRPFLSAGFGLVVGYFGAWLKRVERIENRDLIRYVRKQQLRRLFGRKSIWV